MHRDRVLLLPNAILPQLDTSQVTTQVNELAKRIIDVLVTLEGFAKRVATFVGGGDSFHAIEETRHELSFEMYRSSRWPTSPSTSTRLEELLMQIEAEDQNLGHEIAESLIEGITLTLVSFLHSRAADPLLVRLCSFVIADEIAHEPDYHDNENRTLASTFSFRLRELLCELVGNIADLFVNDLVWQEPQSLADLLFVSIPEAGHFSRGTIRIGVFGELVDEARQFVEQVSSDSREFLKKLNQQDTNGTNRRSWRDVPLDPPASLAIEWFAAGLRSMNGMQYQAEVTR